MNQPVLAAGRFAGAAGVGLLLGLWYGFLRPLRPRFTVLADGAFLLGAFWGWLEVAFRICGGDLRLAYLAGMGLGGIVWDRTAGLCLRGLFSTFWSGVAGFFRGLGRPVKNFLKKRKKELHLRKNGLQ